MSGLDLNQNILSLQAGANAGDVAQVGAEASVDFRGSAQLKRGIMLEAGVSAWAEAQAGFSKFLAADAQVRGEASARLKGQIQAPLDLFSESGVAVRLQAVAELALSGQLAIGLSMGDFIALAQDDPRIDGIHLTLLEIFLEELQIQAGVRGRVAYSAMAYLNLVVAGRLIEDNVNNLPPGFTIAMNCGAGLEGGAGWGLFANLGLKNPRRLIRRSVDAIVDEVLGEVRDAMPDAQSRQMVGLLRAPAKMALRGGFEVGLSLAENAPTFADSGPELARRCVSVILEEAQRFLLEQITTLGVHLIKQGLESIGAGASAWDASADEREFLADQLANQPDDPFEASAESLEYWSGVVNGAVGVGLALGGGLLPDDLVESIALVWAAAQLAFVTTQRVTDASARASFFGALSADARIDAFKGQLVDQAPAPDVIREMINQTLGRSADAELLQDQLVEFITSTALDKLVAEFPETAPFLEIVAGPDASPAALSAAASTILTNAGAFLPNPDTGMIDPETTLRALTDGLQSYIEVRVTNELVPLMHDAIDDQPELGLYVDEVLLPTLNFTVDTVFDSVLDWSFGNVGYREALKDACSSIVMKLLGRSLVVTTDVLVAYASEHVSEELVKLADDVDDPGGFGDQLAAATDTNAELVGEVLHETLLICSEVFGPMPDEKRAKVRNLLYSILDTVPSSPDADWIDQLQTDLFIPDGEARDALLELGGEMSGMLAGYMQAFFTKVMTRVAEIALEELAELVDELIEVVEEWIGGLQDALTALLTRLGELPGEIVAVLNAMNTQLSIALENVQAIFQALPSSPNGLKQGLESALYSPAYTTLIGDDAYVAFPGWVRQLARDALDVSVDAAVGVGLLAPVLQAITIAADEADVALEELQTVLAELREIDPAANVTQQTLDVLLDHLEAAVRAGFDESNPGIPLVVKFSYKTAAFGVKGTPFYVPPQTISVNIDLGDIPVPLDDVIDVVRTAVSNLAVVEDAVGDLVDALMTALSRTDDHTALTLELEAGNQQLPLLEAQVADSCGSGLVGTVLSPQPGALHEGDVPLDLHIAQGCESLLGIGAIEQQRVFVFLNQEPLAMERMSVEWIPILAQMMVLETDLPTSASADTASVHSVGTVHGTDNFHATGISRTTGVARATGMARTSGTTRTTASAHRSAAGNIAARGRVYAGKSDYGRAHTHSVYSTSIKDIKHQTIPVRDIGEAGTRKDRDADARALGSGIRLQLTLSRDELQEGINTLTFAITNGHGETDQQAVSFVVAPAEERAGVGPTLGQHPDWTLHAFPKELVGWLQEADSAVARFPGDGRKEPGGSPREQSNPFWIGTKRERQARRKAVLKVEKARMGATTERVQILKNAVESGGLRPVNRAAPPSPNRERETGPSTEPKPERESTPDRTSVELTNGGRIPSSRRSKKRGSDTISAPSTPSVTQPKEPRQ